MLGRDFCIVHEGNIFRNKKDIRIYLFNTHGDKCCWCKRQLDFYRSTIDHLIPSKDGGSDNIENLRLCCKRCNTLKGDISLNQWKGIIKHFIESPLNNP